MLVRAQWIQLLFAIIVTSVILAQPTLKDEYSSDEGEGNAYQVCINRCYEKEEKDFMSCFLRMGDWDWCKTTTRETALVCVDHGCEITLNRLPAEERERMVNLEEEEAAKSCEGCCGGCQFKDVLDQPMCPGQPARRTKTVMHTYTYQCGLGTSCVGIKYLSKEFYMRGENYCCVGFNEFSGRCRGG